MTHMTRTRCRNVCKCTFCLRSYTCHIHNQAECPRRSSQDPPFQLRFDFPLLIDMCRCQNSLHGSQQVLSLIRLGIPHEVSSNLRLFLNRHELGVSKQKLEVVHLGI